MWKRDDNVRPAPPPPAPSAPPQPLTATSEPPAPAPRPSPHVEKTIVNIGKSVVIKGELSGSEDLIIEGQVDGKIELRDNVLTIGPNGKIKAQIYAKAVIVQGEVTGNVTATEKVDIRDNGSLDGDIASPRVAIAEGAHFRGSIDMQRVAAKPGEGRAAEPKAEPKPAAAAAAAKV
jgi:cytoskeletal protein CcmA (bactofilin family)